MEVWKVIPGFESIYEVSDLGRVRSLDRLVNQLGRGGKPCTRKVPGKLIMSRPHPFGYPVVTLSKNGVASTHTVHSLILSAFVGPRPEGYHTRHLDGNSENSVLSNLSYGTPQKNAEDRRSHGTQRSGERNYNAVRTNDQVREMREARAAGEPLREIAARFGVSELTVHQITTGAKWRDAPGPITPVKRVINKLTPSQAAVVIAMRKRGAKLADVASAFDVSVTQVRNILTRESV